MSKQLEVTIATRTIVRVLLIIVGFIAALLVVQKLGPALQLLALAFFLALALNSSVNFLARRLPGRSRALATGVSYLAVLSVLGILVFSTVPTVVRETADFVGSIPGYIEDLQRNDSAVSRLIDRYDLQDEVDRNLNILRENSGRIAGFAFDRVGDFTSSLVKVVTVLVLTFLMLVEAPRWQRWLWGMYGDGKTRDRHQKLAARMYRVVTGYVNGQVAIATIAAMSTLVVVLVLTMLFDMPGSVALPLAGIIFVTGLIPMVGATIGAVLVSLFLLLYSLPAALIFLAYFIAYQQFENYVIQPVVQSRALDLSPLIVFAAALSGFYVMGPIGGFVAIPVAGCVRVFLLDYLAHRKELPVAEKRQVSKVLEQIES